MQPPRLLALLTLAFAPSAAMAQDVLISNGDFEDPTFTPAWTASGNGEVLLVSEGDSFGNLTATAGILFPSSSQALLLRGGWVGYSLEIGTATHEGYVVTHDALTYEHFEETSSVIHNVFLLDQRGFVVDFAAPAASVGAFAIEALDTSGACGETVELQTSAFTNNFGGGLQAFSLVDDFQQTGAVCAEFVDSDLDGFCPQGTDTDGDGLCTNADEVSPDLVDCDDADPGAFPGASEIVGDGIDQDCDGSDLAGTLSASGVVYHDAAGDGSVSGDSGADAVPVTVWLDGGDGLPDGADDAVLTVVNTDATGAWTATGLVEGNTYWFAVRASAINELTRNAGHTGSEVWAEQTFSAAGGLCDDGTGTPVALPSDGACYGGRRAGVSDSSPYLLDAEHVIGHTMGSSDAAGLDTGFAYNVITHVGDGDDAGGLRSSQGSLRQALLNAAACVGGPELGCVPAVPPTNGTAGGEWWSIAPTSDLPAIDDAGTVLDGAAWCDGRACPAGTLRDANTLVLGSERAVGVGPDLIPDSGDEYLVPAWDGPELELDVARLELASTSEVTGLALYRSQFLVSGDFSVVSDLVVGPRADGSEGAGTVGTGIELLGTVDDVAILHNWIAVEGDGVTRLGSGDRLDMEDNVIEPISGNQDGAFSGLTLHVAFTNALRDDVIVHNWIGGQGQVGVQVGWDGGDLGPWDFAQNTVVGNGRGGGSPQIGGAGMIVRGLDPTAVLDITGNYFADNGGPALVVMNDGIGVRAVGNAFARNLGPAIDLDSNGADPVDVGAGDGVTPNDGAIG